MKNLIASFVAFTLIGATFAPAPDPASTEYPLQWTDSQTIQLKHMIRKLPAEGLANCNISSTPGADASAWSTMAAMQLAAAYLEGCSDHLSRARWHIKSHDNLIDSEQLLRLALQRNELGKLFDAFKPQNPQYHALRAALAREQDPGKRSILALNMERWRWMPLYLGEKYLIVNAASFEVTLWDHHEKVKTWPVIVGKTKTPTPVFDTQVTGVILNPWWDVPSSIVAESVGALVRNRPAEARRRGYVVQNGRYRQRPGPGNALGQMKLIMPNPYAVKLHDTSNRKLFANEVRTYSHGCVRVGGAIDFAKTLLSIDMPDETVDRVLASGKTTPVRISFPIPIYIAYFTAEPGAGGEVIYYPDIYKRDQTRHAKAEPLQDECLA